MKLAVSQASASVGFELAADFELDLSSMKMGNLAGSVAAGGTVGGGKLDGYFIGPLPNPPAFASAGGERLSALSNLYIGLATSGDLPPVQMPGAQERRLARRLDDSQSRRLSSANPPSLSDVQLPSGLSFLYNGPSPFPEICDLDVALQLALTSPAEMALSAACDLDMVIDMNSPDDIKSINSLAMRSIMIGATISPTSTAFTLGAGFHIATSSPLGDSHCDDPRTDAACLTVDASVSVGFISAPQPSVLLAMDLDMEGTWIEPLGLPNFAIASPHFTLGIQIFSPGTPAAPYCPMVTPTGPVPCPVPKQIEWGVTIFWKRSGTWPSALLTKPVPYRAPCAGSADPAQCFPDHDLLKITRCALRARARINTARRARAP